MIRPSPRLSVWSVLVLAGALAGTCAGDTPGPVVQEEAPSASPSVPPDPEEDPAMTAETDAPRALEIGKPTTLRLELPPELASLVRGHDQEAGAPTLRLTLQGLENPRAAVTVRVFVNLPQADATTPIDDPHYVGDVSFFPTGSYGGAAEDLGDSSFLLELGSELAELPAGERLSDEGHLEVTLIPLPLHEAGAETMPTGEIPFAGVKLSVHGGD